MQLPPQVRLAAGALHNSLLSAGHRERMQARTTALTQ